MACRTPGCLGNYDFENIAFYARKRFVEGYDTITLLKQATSDREKEEIALVALLDVEDSVVKDIGLCCRYGRECEITTCREKLKKLIDEGLAEKHILN